MNGDTFDFLKCPFYKDGKATYPRHITKEISLMKLQNIYRAHERVFKAWKEFVSHPKNNLYFTVGNHDHELVYPEVQEDIKVLLGGTENIHFPGLVYKNNGVYVEHGHQYDFLHEINFDNLSCIFSFALTLKVIARIFSGFTLCTLIRFTILFVRTDVFPLPAEESTQQLPS